jgi:hypothetical protein
MWVVPRVNLLIKSLVPDERQGWGIFLFTSNDAIFFLQNTQDNAYEVSFAKAKL